MEDESPRAVPAELPEVAPDALPASSGAPFGPGFFLGQLRAFARECCPSHLEPLPSVFIHLATGEVLGLCHVMGLAPTFVALAVHEEARGSGTSSMAMRTELVPYTLIARVTIRPRGDADAHVGFDAGFEPRLLAQTPTPEEMLAAAARAPPAESSVNALHRDREPA
jgi:hypothetical protein